MGVKSLWSLLTPVGRPVMLETVEGKTMAIDSSIWIYQFQATMRDKEGRGLSNAHVLGFLRRISKLLFYGIKPVFVFDGGAPALKRNTITERKKKKRGAASNHAKVAERLLAAQMRREALNHVGSSKPAKNKGKGKAFEGPVTLDENTVYLEDLDPKLMPKSPVKKTPQKQSPPKKKKFYDYDPYHLPEVDLGDVISKATQSSAPDPRLATEEELQSFIEDMRPENFDVTSPAFRELPTEVQYEIIGDLRLKSRQTSYNRLQNMLRSAKTPLDFSKQQILNLKQRNALTQQLLSTTDSIGKAHIEIPIRIASERNREYVLVKNEGEFGGWILGIRDDGTREKPIEIDQDGVGPTGTANHSDEDMEEVSIVNDTPLVDEDLLGYHREMALAGLSRRRPPKTPTSATQPTSQPKIPLFIPSDDDSDADINPVHVDLDEDTRLAYAIQASMDSTSASKSPITPKTPITPPKRVEVSTLKDGILYSNRLTTALSIAGAGPSRTPIRNPVVSSERVSASALRYVSPELEYISDDAIEIVVPRRAVPVTPPAVDASTQQPAGAESFQSDSDDDMEEVIYPATTPLTTSLGNAPETPCEPTGSPPVADGLTFRLSSSLLGGVNGTSPKRVGANHKMKSVDSAPYANTQGGDKPQGVLSSSIAVDENTTRLGTTFRLNSGLLNPPEDKPQEADNVEASTSRKGNAADISPRRNDESENLEPPIAWSRSSSPDQDTLPEPASLRPQSPVEEDWDAAQEVDVRAEEDEYARFMSQVQGKDLDSVRREIDDEISKLHKEKKTTLRDSEDITQQMISQIMTMLRLFGIPYITAPMEAEAQCAALVSLGLVEGIITDDSDVFLFGGQRVFKNMFNQSKTVECFLLSDLARELGLTRDALVRLAYLLGSDYIEGLPGVGPVVAMELLKEFPGEDGLHKFKDWWMKVQNGQDKPEDSQSNFRKRFKKKFKTLYLPQEWPNAAVRDAYYHPTVDESDEPFKWGLPDLDGLREFLQEELGWHQAKADELLLPIIQRVGKRVQAAALNKQGTLNEYFDLSAGQGSYAPRKRTAYASKRLQKVVSDFRKNNKLRSTASTPDPELQTSEESENEGAPPKKKSKRTSSKVAADNVAPKKATRGRGRGRGRGGSRGRGRGKRVKASNSRQSTESPESAQSTADVPPVDDSDSD